MRARKTFSASTSSVPRNPPIERQPVKLFRLRNLSPLGTQLIVDGAITEEGTDVEFICANGHTVRAHKVILATANRFFAILFDDQPLGEHSVVSVPEIRIDLMKLLLHLHYQERVLLNTEQLAKVTNYIHMFGMTWSHLHYFQVDGNGPNTVMTEAPIPRSNLEMRVNRKEVDQPDSPVESDDEDLLLEVGLESVGVIPNSEPRRSEPGPATYQLQRSDPGPSNSQPQRSDPGPSNSQPQRSDPGPSNSQPQRSDPGPSNSQPQRSDPGTSNSQPQRSDPGPSTSRFVGINDAPVDLEPNTCSVCFAKFNTENHWEWHEKRHLDIDVFKCITCDHKSETAVALYEHEKIHKGKPAQACYEHEKIHKLSNSIQPRPESIKPLANRAQLRAGNRKRPHSFPVSQIKKRIRLANIRTAKPRRKINNKSVKSKEKKSAQPKHWQLICKKCKDSTYNYARARIHYSRCYDKKEKVPFEHSFERFPHGSYGDVQCPICSRKYSNLKGFIIHCGHNHPGYKQLYHHKIGPVNQLKCDTCRRGFYTTTSLHSHFKPKAGGSFYCDLPPVDSADQSLPQAEPSEATQGSSNGVTRLKRKRPASPMGKPSYKIPFQQPPKSARLAKRAQAEAEATTRPTDKPSQDEENDEKED